MNGFATGILSMLLGWLRSFISNGWRLLSSESGGSILSFFAAHWKLIFLVLCAGGFIVDRIIYFFRWRPDLVWRTKWQRMRSGFSRQDEEEELPYAPPPSEATSFRRSQPAPPVSFRRPVTSDPDIPQPTMAYMPSPPPQAEPIPQPTQHYASLANGGAGFAPAAQDKPSYRFGAEASLQDIQPVFDEVVDGSYENPAQDLAPGFGTAKPEPSLPYYQQPGFTPTPPQAAEGVYQPVHPGLDIDTFQQNIGLAPKPDMVFAEEDAFEDFEDFDAPVDFPNTTYVSYIKDEVDRSHKRPLKALSSLAKRARTLVGDDEANPPTIKDLQPVVTMKNAFHPPVLPRKSNEGSEE